MMSPWLPRSITTRAQRVREVCVPVAAMSALGVMAASAVLATAATPPSALAASSNEATDRAASRAWNPFFASQREFDLIDTRRMVITFDDASLGEWVAAQKGNAPSPRQRKAWLKKAAALQKQRLDALTLGGVPFTVEHRYLRVINGASIVMHGDGGQMLQRMTGVASVTPIRTLWPAAIDEEGAAGAAAVVGASASQRVTPSARPEATVKVAVLDAGIDAAHPAVAGRTLRPFDATKPPSAARAAAGVSIRPDEHATAVAGAVLAGAGKDARVQILPVQVLERQPTSNGVDALIGDSDDLLAALEHVVDPNSDGSSSDALDVAVVASTSPYAGFVGSPEDRAVRAADALGTLVVAAAGNDGMSGDDVGTIGSVASSTGALAVGAADLRGEVHAVDVRVRGGGVDETFAASTLLTPHSGKLPGGRNHVEVVDAAADEVVDYLDDQLHSRVTGAVALVMARDGVLVSRQIRAAADAGALAVLVGADHASSAAGVVDYAGVDIPAIGISRSKAGALSRAIAGGEKVTVGFSEVEGRNPAFGTAAGFSSAGPRLDGVGRPDVLAPGVGMIVAGADGKWRSASGTSIAAAWAAGQMASVRAAHPQLSPTDARALVLSTAIPLGEDRNRPSVAAQGAGVINVKRAVHSNAWFVRGGRIDFGSVAGGQKVSRALDIASLSGDPAPQNPKILLDDGGSSSSVAPGLSQGKLLLNVAEDAPSGHIGGWLVMPDLKLRIPWTATIRDSSAVKVPMRARVTNELLKPAAGPGAFASSLELAIGGTSKAGSLGISGIEHLEVRLVDSRGKQRGVIGGLDQVLPGIYLFGITGVDAGGRALAAGRWTLQVRYVPAQDPDGAWRLGPSSVIRVAPKKRK